MTFKERIYITLAIATWWIVTLAWAWEAGAASQSRLVLDAYGAVAEARALVAKARHDHNVFHHGYDLGEK